MLGIYLALYGSSGETGGASDRSASRTFAAAAVRQRFAPDAKALDLLRSRLSSAAARIL
jgi:hypothetical protein